MTPTQIKEGMTFRHGKQYFRCIYIVKDCRAYCLPAETKPLADGTYPGYHSLDLAANATVDCVTAAEMTSAPTESRFGKSNKGPKVSGKPSLQSALKEGGTLEELMAITGKSRTHVYHQIRYMQQKKVVNIVKTGDRYQIK